MERDLPRPALIAALALFAGQSLARGFGVEGLALPGLVLALAFACTRFARTFHWMRVLTVVLAFGALGAGLQGRLSARDREARAALAAFDPAGSSIATVEGILAGQPRIGDRGIVVVLRGGARLSRGGRTAVLATPLPVRIVRTPRAEAALWASPAGTTLRFLGSVESLPARQTPGNLDSRFVSEGAVAVVRATTILPSVAESADWRTGYDLWLREVQTRVERSLSDSMSDSGGGLLAAMLLGRTDLLSVAQREDFRATGLVHLFSVSGLHAGFVAILIVRCASLFGFGPRRRALLIVLGLFFFVSLTGYHSPVVRASLLTVAFVLQPILRRGVEPVSALAAVAMLIVVADPLATWQLDFQLSFLCAAVLAALSPTLVRLEEVVGPKLGWGIRGWLAVEALKILVVSAAVQLVLAPILFAQFGQVSLVAPLANLVVLPVLGVLLPMCLATLMLQPVLPVPADFVLGIADYAMQATGWVAHLFAEAPHAVLGGGAWPLPLAFAYYAILSCGRWLRQRRVASTAEGVSSALVQALAATALLVWLPLFSPAAPELTVRFVDVGQGDCIAVQTGDGATLVVDAGPRAGEALAMRLRAMGIDRIDVFVATHADADHIGGAAGLLRSMRVGRVAVGGSLANTGVWGDLAREVASRRLPVTRVERGAVLQLGDMATARVLHPTPDFVEAGDDRNDGSVVLMLESGESRILLTGDAEAPAEGAMVAALGDELSAQVLKAGHHGSATSSSENFVRAVHPAVAVISCGARNRYGHPAAIALERLEHAGAAIRRTDREGTVTVVCEAGELRIGAEGR